MATLPTRHICLTVDCELFKKRLKITALRQPVCLSPRSNCGPQMRPSFPRIERQVSRILRSLLFPKIHCGMRRREIEWESSTVLNVGTLKFKLQFCQFVLSVVMVARWKSIVKGRNNSNGWTVWSSWSKKDLAYVDWVGTVIQSMWPLNLDTPINRSALDKLCVESLHSSLTVGIQYHHTSYSCFKPKVRVISLPHVQKCTLTQQSNSPDSLSHPTRQICPTVSSISHGYFSVWCFEPPLQMYSHNYLTSINFSESDETEDSRLKSGGQRKHNYKCQNQPSLRSPWIIDPMSG